MVITVIRETSKMRNNRRVDGYDFEFVSQNGGEDEFYQCRGDVMYDDDHDETPEPGLWHAATKLSRKLNTDGENTSVNHSEKGWVEVTIEK